MVKNYRTKNLCLQAMRITLLITISHVFILTAIASGKASAQQISLDLKQTPVKKVFTAIEKQAGVSFTYSESTLSKVPPVDITVDRKSLSEVLQQLGRELSIEFKQIGKTIAVSGRPKNAHNRPPQFETSGFPVSGSVTDAQGTPLPGVNVRVKGKTATTTTDTDGKFRIEADINDVLVLSYIGFVTKEVTVRDLNNISIQMEANMNNLEEVTVVSTGYQDIPKERATGSFAKVDNNLLNRRISSNILDRLEGAVSGLVFNRSSSSETSISIRGQSTIYGNNSPLIVLDGFAYDGNISSINPNDIQDISFLKDAAAASIWGVRAGNGVIVINTIKGRNNAPLTIDFNSNFTRGEKPNIFYRPSISTSGFIEMERQLFIANFYRSDEINTLNRPALSPVVEMLIANRDGKLTNGQLNERLQQLGAADVRRDFDKYFLQNSSSQQYSLNLKGGFSNFRYAFSAGFDDIYTSMTGNTSGRFTLRTDNSLQVAKNLELNMGIYNTQTNGTQNSPGLQILNGSTSLKGLYPYAHLSDDNGQPLEVNYGYRQTFIEEAERMGLLDWSYSPLADLQNSDNRSKENYLRLISGLTYKIRPFISASINYQLERASTIGKRLQVENMYFTRDLINRYSSVDAGNNIVRPIPRGSILDNTLSELTGHTFRAQFTLSKSWDNSRHEINGITGLEVKENKNAGNSSRLYGYNENYLTSTPIDYNTFFKFYNSTAFTGRIPALSVITDLTNRFRSYYANLSYTFLNRYTFSSSGRIDGSNLFGVEANKKSVPLWSVGLRWQIHKEPFFKVRWIDNLAFRGTFGYNGNIDKSVTAFTTASRSTDVFTGLPMATILNPPNPNLQWERTGIFNAGIDFSLMNQRVSGSLEFYAKNGRNLLGFQSLDPTTGVIRYKGNVGSFKGSGVDLILSSLNVDKTIKWNSSLLLSYATDKVTRMNLGRLTGALVTTQSGAFGNTAVNIIPVVGRPVYGIFSFRNAGLDPTNGDPRGYLNGEISKAYSAIRSNVNIDELVFNGTARPKYFGSIRNTVSYKSIYLSGNISYKLGHVFRRGSIDYGIVSKNWTGHSDFDIRWQKAGDEATTVVPSLPLVSNTARDLFYQYSDVLIEDASHIRLQDINLTYDVPLKGLIRSIKSFSAYLFIDNVGLLWTKNTKGIDPDYIPLSNSIYLPSPRTYSIGIRAGF